MRSWAGVKAPPAAAPAPGAAPPHPGAAPAGHPGAAPGADPGATDPKGLAASAKTAFAALQQAAQEIDEVAAAAEMAVDADPQIADMLAKVSEATAELLTMMDGLVTTLDEDGDEDDEADQDDELDDEDV